VSLQGVLTYSMGHTLASWGSEAFGNAPSSSIAEQMSPSSGANNGGDFV
jgi:hypothetical protein